MSNPVTTSTHVVRRRLPAALVLVGAAALATACGSPSASSVSAPQPAVAASSTSSAALLGTASNSLGTILVDAQGRTVYEFASDSKDTSTCTGSCLTYWPAVTAPATLPSSLPGITGTVGSFTRPDGGRQVTINGLPLYTYVGDTAPGMTTGQGSNASGAKWWVVSPDGSPITDAGPASTPAPSSGY